MLRALVGIALFGGVVVAALRSWTDVRATIARIAPLELLAAESLVLVGLVLSVLTWMTVLREMGWRPGLAASSKIYLIGQLGKYLPGSLWAVAVQMEMARTAGVPRSRGVTASIVAIGVNVVTGLAIGLVLVPTRSHSGIEYGAVVICWLAACVLLSPPVLTRVVDLALAIGKRPLLGRRLTWIGTALAVGWSSCTWLSYGLSVWLLALGAGAPAGESLPLCLAGVPLAMTLGVLVVVAPSGVGVREAVIVAALVPVMSRADAIAVALLARLLFTLADLIAAAAVTPIRIQRSEPLRSHG